MMEYEGKYLVKAPGNYYYKGEDSSGFNYTREPREALVFEDKESAEQLAYSLNSIADGVKQHIVGGDIYGRDIYCKVVSMDREVRFHGSPYWNRGIGQYFSF